jgi:hypothetical protein
VKRISTSDRRPPLPSGAARLRVPLAVVALVVLIVFPSAAAADPGSNPAVDQYVESVPSSGGDTPSGGSHSGGNHRLPPAVRHQIHSQGGADAPELEAVASSPALGAPPTTPATPAATGGAQGGGSSNGAARNRHVGAPGAPGATSVSDKATSQPDSRPSVVTAAADALVGSGSSGVGLLLVGLFAVSAACGTAVLMRRRSDPR